MEPQERLSKISFKARNFMCFGDKPQGFDVFRPINLIIGRNNAGKTALIEMLHYATGELSNVPEHLFHNGLAPEFYFEQELPLDAIKKVFAQNVSGGAIPGNHWDYGQKFISQLATIIQDNSINNKGILLPPGMDETIGHNLIGHINSPFRGKQLLRLSSERDISTELESPNSSLQKNGVGATRMLHEIFNSAKFARLPEAIKFVTELNRITEPDLSFTKIEVKKDENSYWEVFLTEENKVPIQLSRLGSGLKTIILILLLLNVIPRVDPRLKGRPVSDLLFAFEEIENYLHPAIQRRLLLYIREYMLKNGCTAFITSHSNVSIDMLSKDSNAQLIHVVASGLESKVEHAATYIQHKGILDDLDVRASDILQSNGVIWVEGPSDRVYLNRWIALMSDGRLREGAHYQIVFYGGRLLSHLSSSTPNECDNLISILRVNKNAAIVIDSDKREETDGINSTKSRLVNEILGTQGVAWVTEGREIENYIPMSVLKRIYSNIKEEAPNKYGSFFDYLNTIQEGDGDRYKDLKPVFAETITEVFQKSDISMALDLHNRLTEICNAICRWNNIPAL